MVIFRVGEIRAWQVIVLNCSPLPQVTEHDVHSPGVHSAEHGLVLHGTPKSFGFEMYLQFSSVTTA
uniref:Uncharacterized protein n=1 Tax=Arion vulgaris TaxID=1028688 RepID=A0A0B7AUY3_9EUPU